MSANVDLNNRPDYDQVIQDLADYVLTYQVTSREALDTARNCLMDTLGCGLLSLRFPECTKLLGPVVPGTIVRRPSSLSIARAISFSSVDLPAPLRPISASRSRSPIYRSRCRNSHPAP